MNSRGTVHASALRPEGEDSGKKLPDGADSRAVQVTKIYRLFRRVSECVYARIHLLVFLPA